MEAGTIDIFGCGRHNLVTSAKRVQPTWLKGSVSPHNTLFSWLDGHRDLDWLRWVCHADLSSFNTGVNFHWHFDHSLEDPSAISGHAQPRYAMDMTALTDSDSDWMIFWSLLRALVHSDNHEFGTGQQQPGSPLGRNASGLKETDNC
jgi:hypothetical protein